MRAIFIPFHNMNVPFPGNQYKNRKSPRRQRRRCLRGFQKGEDKYLTLSLVQKCITFPKVTSGGFVLSDNTIIVRFLLFIH